jgi:pimeloyl-ACP methyl ester carboxylesterase
VPASHPCLLTDVRDWARCGTFRVPGRRAGGAVPNTVRRSLDLRAALGASRLDLFVVSYGTRAALTYLHRDPARVRSVVPQGVVAPEWTEPRASRAA